jgi:hypothetical protein
MRTSLAFADYNIRRGKSLLRKPHVVNTKSTDAGKIIFAGVAPPAKKWERLLLKTQRC